MENNKGWIGTFANEVNEAAKNQSGWEAFGGAVLVTAVGASALVLGGPVGLAAVVGVISAFDAPAAAEGQTTREKMMNALSFPIFALSTYVATAKNVARSVVSLYHDLTDPLPRYEPAREMDWSGGETKLSRVPKASASFNRSGVPEPGMELAKRVAMQGLDRGKNFRL